MEGLYKKIVKGTYPKIPNTYSPDLNLVIKTLLQVQPNARPNCGSPNNKILCLNRSDLPAALIIKTTRKDQHPQSRRRHVPDAPDHSSPQKSLLFNRKTAQTQLRPRKTHFHGQEIILQHHRRRTRHQRHQKTPFHK